jgi:hypothetical protein
MTEVFMGTCICACGAKYRFAEKASGKEAKCKRCGEALKLESRPISGAPRHPDPTVAASPSVLSPIPEPIVEVESPEEGGPLQVNARERGYGRALMWAMVFPSSIHNLIAFLTIWLVMTFVSVIPVPGLTFFRLGYFLWFFWIVIVLWYAAFRINVIESSAMGSFRLPDVEISRDLLLDLLGPGMRWFGSWLAVMIPAIIYVIDRAYDGVNVLWNTWQALINLPFGGGGGTVDPVLVGLVAAGLFFWPIVVLVVTIGDFSELRHFERVFITLGRAPGPYLLTVLIVAASYGVQILVAMAPAVTTVFGTAGTTPGAWLSQHILGTGINLYVSIVAAMTIGLYFRHFGHRFAWDWGQTES